MIEQRARWAAEQERRRWDLLASLAATMAPHDEGKRVRDLLDALDDAGDPEARYTPPPPDGGPPPGMTVLPLVVVGTNGAGH